MRLPQPEMIDDELRVGVAGREPANLIEAPRARQVDRQVVTQGRRESAIDARVGRIA